MRYLTTFLFIFIASFNAFSQYSFFRTDSTSSSGLKIVDNGPILNAMQCEVIEKENTKSKIYSPYTVNKYGLDDGRVYVSKYIQIGDSTKKVFLEQLVKNKTSLYVYNAKNTKIFYIEKDSSSLIELSKYDKENNDFRVNLSKITNDCENVKDAVKLVDYTNKSLSKLINNYNDCIGKPFPVIKYGFIVGYGFRDLEVVADGLYKHNGYIKDKFKSLINNKYEASILPGAFIDLPIAMSCFSLHADIYLSKYRYSFTNTSESEILDFVANTTSIYLPILMRYSFSGKTLRPFVNVGLNNTYNLQNSTVFYETPTDPDYISLQSVDRNSYISKFQPGFTAGAGIECKLNYKHSIFIEFRYNKQFGISDTDTFNNTQMDLLASINI